MGVYKTWPTPFGLPFGLPLAHSWLSFAIPVVHSWPSCGPLLAYQPCISNTYDIWTCHNNVVLMISVLFFGDVPVAFSGNDSTLCPGVTGGIYSGARLIHGHSCYREE